MTYAFGTETVESSPETSRWYKLTPQVISWLQATRAQDPGVQSLLARAASGLAFMGVSATGEDLFWVTATESGNMGGSYKAPAASDAPVMTYEQVLRVFEPSASGPLTKRVFRKSASSRVGLYVGIAAGVAALLAGVAYLAMKKKTGTALAANATRGARARGEMKEYTWKCTHCGRTVHNHDPKRIGKSSRRCSSRASGPCQFRRARASLRLHRNGPADYTPRFGEDFGQEQDDLDYRRASAVAGVRARQAARAAQLRRLSALADADRDIDTEHMHAHAVYGHIPPISRSDREKMRRFRMGGRL